jgi:taurine dioxygenase
MSLDIQPLSPRHSFGATITGLRRGDLDDVALRRRLHDLWIDKGVIVFRGVETSEDMHVSLSRCFGDLEVHPLKRAYAEGKPELIAVRYIPNESTTYLIDDKPRGACLPWHSDLVYVDRINHGGILKPIGMPKTEGETGFIDQISAYERLPENLKRRIEDLHVIYKLDLDISHQKFGKRHDVKLLRFGHSTQTIMDRAHLFPRVLHPMVYSQPDTGRKVLNVSPWFAVGIHGMEGPEGDALLAEVVEYCTDDSLAYYHQWREDDMVLWDNWRMLHSAAGVPADQIRDMVRTTIAGDYSLGRLENPGAVVDDLQRVSI